MKINYQINKNLIKIDENNKVKIGDIVLCTENIWNVPKKGRDMKKLLFAKNTNYKVHSTTRISFTVGNDFGTLITFNYRIGTTKFMKYGGKEDQKDDMSSRS